MDIRDLDVDGIQQFVFISFFAAANDDFISCIENVITLTTANLTLGGGQLLHGDAEDGMTLWAAGFHSLTLYMGALAGKPGSREAEDDAAQPS